MHVNDDACDDDLNVDGGGRRTLRHCDDFSVGRVVEFVGNEKIGGEMNGNVSEEARRVSGYYMAWVTRHMAHVTRHTSHVTRHTSHVTRHTSHFTYFEAANAISS